ncbi:LytTR family two component transcriptional regulator [Mucilaginibacter oryzae]|uniref:LytTR family two component transcriptional regulator n=1 Tax=Mucilaginibacter oryzae TaxID=468058 RepID=A0A316GTL9_9SPHI|nr:response regulator transcription factor [Mucilaginibacter oryzae]PWK65768.1 LytTR family two component transcriptional regulator [Mucilaginibacter oryzae]
MERTKVLIIEDEPFVAETIRTILEETGYFVAGVFSSGEEMLDNFHPKLADIIIMDIHLKGNMNGVETSLAVRKISPTPIIYVTDNNAQALRKKAIFETNTVQYLTKPFTAIDLDVAIDLALKTLRKDAEEKTLTNESPYLADDCIFIKEGESFSKLHIDKIVMLQADGAYCKLFYKNNKNITEKILFSENMSVLEDKLQFAKNLYRIHRSYIINVSYLSKIQENRLWIEDEELPIGKTYRHDFKNRIRFM